MDFDVWISKNEWVKDEKALLEFVSTCNDVALLTHLQNYAYGRAYMNDVRGKMWERLRALEKEGHPAAAAFFALVSIGSDAWGNFMPTFPLNDLAMSARQILMEGFNLSEGNAVIFALVFASSLTWQHVPLPQKDA